MKTLKDYRETTPLEEQRIFAEKLHTWLGEYTQEVFEHVMQKHMEEIINNDFSLKLIDELHERTLKEKKDEIRNIEFALGHNDDENLATFHLHPLEHSNSYRDVLYDMYIRDRHDQ